MVRFEHANLVVKEIQPTLEFLLTAFPEWRLRGSGEGRWGDAQRNWVHVGDDEYYITLNDSAEGDMRDISSIQPGLAHLGFVVDDLQGVTERLWAQGYAIDILGMDHPYRKTLYYTDPAGFQFEFLEYNTEQTEERNLYGGETGPFRFNVRSLTGEPV